MTPTLLLRGCALGFAAAVPIGPVNVEIARRTLRGGFSDGFALGCGAVTIDVAYAVVVSIAMRGAFQFPKIVMLIGFLGAALLAYLGIMCLRAAFAEQPHVEPGDRKKTPAHRNYLTGLLLTALNPMTLVFWFTAVPGVAGQLTRDPRHDLPLICLGVFLATISWVCTFTALVTWAGGFGRRGTWLRAADILGGALLLTFAIGMIWRVTQRLLS